MSRSEVLCAIAVVLIAGMLWLGRQARIVHDEVKARLLAMQAEDLAEEQQNLRRERRRVGGVRRRRRC